MKPGGRPTVREGICRQTLPQDQARVPSRWSWPHLRRFDAVSGCGIAFPLNAILAPWKGVREGAAPCTGNELPRRLPFRHVVLGSPAQGTEF
jgi:hypothetical protein